MISQHNFVMKNIVNIVILSLRINGNMSLWEMHNVLLLFLFLIFYLMFFTW